MFIDSEQPIWAKNKTFKLRKGSGRVLKEFLFQTYQTETFPKRLSRICAMQQLAKDHVLPSVRPILQSQLFSKILFLEKGVKHVLFSTENKRVITDFIDNFSPLKLIIIFTFLKSYSKVCFSTEQISSIPRPLGWNVASMAKPSVRHLNRLICKLWILM